MSGHNTEERENAGTNRLSNTVRAKELGKLALQSTFVRESLKNSYKTLKGEEDCGHCNYDDQ